MSEMFKGSEYILVWQYINLGFIDINDYNWSGVEYDALYVGTFL